MNKPGWPVLLAIAVAIVVIGVLAGALIAGNGGEGEQTIVTVPASVDATAADDAGSGADRPGETAIEDDDVPLGQAEAKRVAAAARAAAGGGEVVEISRSDDPGEAYEVEVITDRGEIDIALDDNLNRVDNQAYDD